MRHIPLLLLLAGLLTPGPVRADEPYRTIEELWSGIDPQKDPFEVESLHEWTENDLHFQQFYFTGEVFEGQRIRVYAVQGSPVGRTKLPGILHIHGGGQTVSMDWVRFWARRGYVVLSFDYCGDWRKMAPDRKEFTRYGTLPYDMIKVSGPGMKPDARHNPFFHWTLLAQRALTLLERHPRVDPQRLGIFGVSVGGSLTWLVAGTDRRVSAAVPIYGCGWNSYITPQQTDADPIDDETRLSRRLISSEAYAPLVKCPVLFLDASNDFHGNMDRSFATLARASTPEIRQAYTPRYNHHLEPAEGRDLPLWMDRYLKGEGESWPRTPEIRIVGGNDAPRIEVRPDRFSAIKSVRIYYSLSNAWPQSRFWRGPAAKQSAPATYAADAPFFAVDDVIYAFANVTYESGMTLSSLLISANVKSVPGAKPTLAWEAQVDNMDDDEDWRYGPGYTDPCISDTYFRPWLGPHGERGFTLNAEMWSGRDIDFNFGTHKIGDPQWRGRGRDTLLIDCDAARPVHDLRIKVREREWQPNGHEYTMTVGEFPRLPASVPSKPEPGWRTIEISPDQLKDAQGIALGGWSEVNMLELTGVARNSLPPLMRNLRWAKKANIASTPASN